jgi:hypothetical protein
MFAAMSPMQYKNKPHHSQNACTNPDEADVLQGLVEFNDRDSVSMFLARFGVNRATDLEQVQSHVVA